MVERRPPLSLLTHLVQATRLSQNEREELHALLAKLESPPPKPKRRHE